MPMLLKEFYTRVLPAQGQYVLWQKVRGPQWHTWYPTIDALVEETQRRIDTQGLYFGTAGFGDLLEDDTEKPGYGEPVRKLENVVALRAFRFDIDAGEEKFKKHPNDAYPTQRDALTALIGFVKATNLLPTLIVSSGEGLHVYWCLDEDVPRDWWTPLARTLNAVGRANGLRVDGGITVDAARILRPLGTPHKNGKRVALLRDTARVYSQEEFAQAVTALAPEEVEFDLATARAPRAANINDDILHVEGPPASLARVAEHCAAVALMREQSGNVPEPHWRAVMGVAKYCEDGEQRVHEWSSGYQGYSKRETQEKFDRWETPPTTCQHFSLMFTGCNGCQYRGKITTPKQVGYIAIALAEAPAAIPDAPASTAAQDLAGAKQTTGAGTDGTSSQDPTTGTELGAGMALPDEPEAEATVACPVPDRPDLFDEASPFYYKVVDNRWTLFHKYKEATKDATGQTVWVEHVKPVAYKLFWVDSNSLPGATDTGGVLIQFGRVERPGSTRQDRMDMPAGTSADVKKLCTFLVDQGINLAPRSLNKNATEHIKEYVAREIIRKQNDMRFVIKDRFGYHFHEGQFVCSLGQYTVYPDGVVMKTVCNSKLHGLAKSLTTTALESRPGGRWDPTVWHELAPHVAKYVQFLRKHYGRPGFEPARLAIAINLASPFLVFAGDSVFSEGAEELPATGFVLSLFSEASGIGKSSLMAAIAAAYGKDTLARKGNDASITPVAAITTAANTAIYPMLLDEVTQNDASRAAANVDTFANGQGRVRAKSDGAVGKPAETWALVTCVATNVPQRELLSHSQKRSDALLKRLLELNFDPIPHDTTPEQIEAFRADLKVVQEHCGAFGLFQALAAVKAGHKRLTEMTSANVARAFELLGVSQDFRFYARMLGALLTNQQLLGRWAPFTEEELVASFQRAIRDTTWYVENNRTSPEGELGALISELSPHIAVTKSWTKRTGRAGETDVLLNSNVRQPILGREVQDWGCVLLECNAVRDWCVKQQQSVSGFVQKMEEAGLLVKMEGKERMKLRINTGLMNLPTEPRYFFKFRVRGAEAAEGSADNVVSLHSAAREEDLPADSEQVA